MGYTYGYYTDYSVTYDMVVNAVVEAEAEYNDQIKRWLRKQFARLFWQPVRPARTIPRLTNFVRVIYRWSPLRWRSKTA